MNERSELEKLFENAPKKNLGRTREVLDTRLEGEGLEGSDYILKEKESDRELAILNFLHDTEVGEQLLAQDGKMLAIKKIEGKSLDEAVRQIVATAPELITREVDLPPAQSGLFKPQKMTVKSLPREALFQNEKVRKLCIDYLAKLFFLLSNGILHNDIQATNVFVTKDNTVHFIDFGRSLIVRAPNSETITHGFLPQNLYLGFTQLQSLSPDFDVAMTNLQAQSKDGYRTLFEKIVPFLTDLYRKFEEEKIALAQRPQVLEKELGDNPDAFRSMLTALGVPIEISDEVYQQVLTSIDRYLGNNAA